MQDLLDRLGPIEQVHCERISLQESFLDLAESFCHLEGTVLLQSCGTRDSSRRSFLAISPWLTLKAKRQGVRLEVDGHREDLSLDPFQALRLILNHFHLPDRTQDLPLSGLFGYLAYDLKDHLESLPRTALDDLGLPQMLLYCPRILVEHEPDSSHALLRIPLRRREQEDRAGYLLQWFQKMRGDKHSGPAESGVQNREAAVGSTFSRAGYRDAVEAIREYIRTGHVYQVNLSQRFCLPAPEDGFSAFRELFASNPAPFFAYIQAGDHQILSTSPERFLSRRGSAVESRPIKGTRPRGEDRERDRELAGELQQSPKDQAELSMIVDLVRNDLGRVCTPGSVEVTQHQRLESYSNVHHLVSVVTGELASERDSTDLVRAAFPGGSITGCPKVRAMQIIDELEPRCRHVYTGSIGYFGFNSCLDLSIAIRTATLMGDTLLYSVGGGVVFDSDPDAEYRETLDKAKTLRKRLSAETNPESAEEYVWIDGGLAPRSQAGIPFHVPGFQYGAGLFETLRAQQGEPLFLQEHLRRLRGSWWELFPTPAPDPDWEEIIRLTLEANHLLDRTAAVKLVLARGSRNQPPYDDYVAVQCRPYTDRLQRTGSPGLRLATHPEPRTSPLTDHKSLNHLYYIRAGDWAIQQGADEALILNPDGSASETNSANLLLLYGDSLLLPSSPHVLPGITQELAAEILSDMGYSPRRERIFPGDLREADAVIITNSLMGAVSATQIDGQPLANGTDIASRITRILFRQE